MGKKSGSFEKAMKKILKKLKNKKIEKQDLFVAYL